MPVFTQRTAAERAELWAVLALRHCKGIGAVRANKLVAAYGSALQAVEAGLGNPNHWREQGLAPQQAVRFFAAEKWREKATAEWRNIQKSGVHFLLHSDPDFPASLRTLPDAPLLLYYKGDISLMSLPSVGIVGARQCTREGIAVSAFFAGDLSNAGICIISGMAKGIDRAAHRGGLGGPGKSIAVLGTGIDLVYPSCNHDLAVALAQQGLLISEFALGVKAAPAHFPIRNRIISGLSQGILVVEAAGRSGSLITARLALEQGREVFAVPGHTMAGVSAGCRELIRRGAKPVFCADDILVELAPLLTHYARKALEERMQQPSSGPQARNRHDEPYLDVQAKAQAVLPEGGVPWVAPTGGKVSGQSHVLFDDDVLFSEKDGFFSQAKQESTETVEHSVELTDDEQQLLPAVGAVPLHIDAIALAAELDISHVSRILLRLELKGVVARRAGGLYCRC